MVWMRPAGSGKGMTGDAGGWTGYVKVRDSPAIRSKKVKAQNQKMRKAANECKGKSRSEFLSCMSSRL